MVCVLVFVRMLVCVCVATVCVRVCVFEILRVRARGVCE